MTAAFRRLEKMFNAPLRMLGRIVVKLISYDVVRLRMHVAGPRIHGPEDRVKLGKNVDLQNAYLNTVCGTITFEDHAFCGQYTMFLTGTHDYAARNEARHAHPDSGYDIVVGRGAWICSGAIVIGPAKIAPHAVIAAGAVVTGDCPEAGIYAGVPAKCVRRIDFHAEAPLNRPAGPDLR